LTSSPSVHEGKKPFKCDICDYSSSDMRDMNRHVASIHKGNNLLRYIKM
jgi:hypothetical protein